MLWDRWLFDGIIFFFLIAGGAGILESYDRARKSERYGWHVIIFILGVAWLVIFYGSFVEPRIILTHEYDVDITTTSATGEEIKVVVLGDFHLGPYNDEYLVENVVRKVNKIKPDLILLVGDYITNKDRAVLGFAAFTKLKPPYGIFAVTGNHDYLGDDVEAVVNSLQGYGVHFLRNSGATIKIDGKELYLAGVDDYWFGEMDVTEALINKLPGQPSIFLAHNPDVVKYVPLPLRFGIMVSGHTHGGQIRLPLIGSLVQPPTDLPKEYSKGRQEYEGRQMFITSGLGQVGPRARLFNPPEIAVLNVMF
jgi:predicted MPP superfamily phosphohydrolase